MNSQRESSVRKKAVVIGAGFGGLAMGIRLQSMGYDTTIVEACDQPGGRGMVLRRDGYVFDMGPTVITVPHFIEELFAAERDAPALDPARDFPPEVLRPEARVRQGVSGGPRTSDYCTIIPLDPFYRIWFQDGTYFDYTGDPEQTRAQIRKLAPEDLEGYERFHAAAGAIFERGFLQLGYTGFFDVGSMLSVAPDLLTLGAAPQTLFGLAKRHFKSDKMRQVFSFETLLIGGSPANVPAIYAMIHFVEKTWGVHFVMGGTGELVRAFVRKFEDLGGTIRLSAPVARILVDDDGPALLGRKGVARGVALEGGEEIAADVVVSNADWAHTYGTLVDRRFRRVNADWRIRVSRFSMSVVVIYFGFRRDPELDAGLRHHNIVLGPRYEALLKDIFDRKILADDFSQYLHVPTLTDPSMAPEGHHAAYTLVPVPHNGSGIDWAEVGEGYVQTVLRDLEERGFIPNLSERMTTMSYITPDHFQHTLRSHLGNAFGIEPVLTQSAFFRPHNRSEDIRNLYLVGASAQPGAGTPSVMMSAKMTARAIAEDVGLGVVDAEVRRRGA